MPSSICGEVRVSVKGKVEGLVGYARRNFLASIPPKLTIFSEAEIHWN
jgi:transposase